MARSLELNLHLSFGWEGLKCLSHQLLPSRVCKRGRWFQDWSQKSNQDFNVGCGGPRWHLGPRLPVGAPPKGIQSYYSEISCDCLFICPLSINYFLNLWIKISYFTWKILSCNLFKYHLASILQSFVLFEIPKSLMLVFCCFILPINLPFLHFHLCSTLQNHLTAITNKLIP